MGSCFRRQKDGIRVLGILLYIAPINQESSNIMSLFEALLSKVLKTNIVLILV